jgi:hypothetical protein
VTRKICLTDGHSMVLAVFAISAGRFPPPFLSPSPLSFFRCSVVPQLRFGAWKALSRHIIQIWAKCEIKAVGRLLLGVVSRECRCEEGMDVRRLALY